MIVPRSRMFLMEVPVRRSVGAVPFLVFLRICESFLVCVFVFSPELLVETLVLRMIEKVAEDVLVVV
jgi:hypothetical protein